MKRKEKIKKGLKELGLSGHDLCKMFFIKESQFYTYLNRGYSNDYIETVLEYLGIDLSDTEVYKSKPSDYNYENESPEVKEKLKKLKKSAKDLNKIAKDLRGV